MTKTIMLQESPEGHFRAEIDDTEVRLIRSTYIDHSDKPIRLEPVYPKLEERVVAYIPAEQWWEIAMELPGQVWRDMKGLQSLTKEIESSG